MALRNAFQDLATEETVNDILVEEVTLTRELMEQILFQLRLLNARFEEAFETELNERDM